MYNGAIKKPLMLVMLGMFLTIFSVYGSALKPVPKKGDQPCIGDKNFAELSPEKQAAWLLEALQKAPIFFSGKCCKEVVNNLNPTTAKEVDTIFQSLEGNKEKDSVLLYAIRMNNVLACNCLIESGFSLDSRDKNGNTIWHLLSQKKYGRSPLWEIILSKVNDVNGFILKNDAGEMPIDLFLKERPLMSASELEKRVLNRVVSPQVKMLKFDNNNNLLHLFIKYNQSLEVIKDIFPDALISYFLGQQNSEGLYPGDMIISFNKVMNFFNVDFFSPVNFTTHYQAGPLLDYFFSIKNFKINKLLLFAYFTDNKVVQDILKKHAIGLKNNVDKLLYALYLLYKNDDTTSLTSLLSTIEPENIKPLFYMFFNTISNMTVLDQQKIRFFASLFEAIKPFYDITQFRNSTGKTLLHILVQNKFPKEMIIKLFSLGFTGYEKDKQGKIALDYVDNKEIKTLLTQLQSKRVTAVKNDHEDLFEYYLSPIAFFIDDSEIHHQGVVPEISSSAITKLFLLYTKIQNCPLIVSKNIFYNIFCRQNNLYELAKDSKYKKFINAYIGKKKKALYESLLMVNLGIRSWIEELMLPLLIANTNIDIDAWDFYVVDSNFMGMVPKSLKNRAGLRIADWQTIEPSFFDYFKYTTTISSKSQLDHIVNYPECLSEQGSLVPIKNINVPQLLSKIFLTNTDFLQTALQRAPSMVPIKKPVWVVYGVGHGMINDSIIGLSVAQFKDLLSFFNTKIKVDSFFYDSCFSGGTNAKHFFDDVQKAVSIPYSFTIASNSITDEAVTPMIFKSSFALEGVHVFDANIVKGYQDFYKKFEDAVVGDITVEHIVTLLMLYVPKDQQYVYVRLPNTEWFSVNGQESNIGVIGNNLAFSDRKVLNVTQFFRHKKNLLRLAVYPHYIPFSIDLSGSKNIVGIVPMNGGNYYIDAIIADVSKDVLFIDMFSILNKMQNTSFLIPKITINGVDYIDVIVESPIDVNTDITSRTMTVYYVSNNQLWKESINHGSKKKIKTSIIDGSVDMQHYQVLKTWWSTQMLPILKKDYEREKMQRINFEAMFKKRPLVENK